MRKISRHIVSITVLLLILLAPSSCAPLQVAPLPENYGVKITQLEDRLTVEINGKLFTEYRFKDVAQPHFYPVVGPTDEIMVRRWPVEEGEDGPYEQHDHKGHIGIWFGHEVNYHRWFWCVGKKHEKFLEISSGPKVGIIKCQNKWVTQEDEVICTDTRTYKFYNRKDDRIMDYEITIHASEGDVTFNDSKEGTMAIRVATSMALRLDSRTVASRFRMKRKPDEKDGHILLSTGLRDDQTWGKRAAWCDYYGPGPEKGETVGVAVFDHPKNPRHPTWWMVRDYGLLAANPFGAHTFGKEPEGAGDLTIPAGQEQTFRYRFYFHKGDPEQADVAGKYREYAAASCPVKATKCSKAAIKCVKSKK